MDVLETEVVMLRSALEAANSRVAELEAELRDVRDEMQELADQLDDMSFAEDAAEE